MSRLPAMALEHAILVALRERAGTGYELARRFDKSIGFFYGASHQQIYRTLKRMTADGWIDAEEVPGGPRGSRRVHSVSALGAEVLRAWLAEPSAPPMLRDELSVKIRGAAYGDLATLVANVRERRALHETRLRGYLRMQADDFPDPAALDGTPLHQYLVLRGGIRGEEMLVSWYDEILAALDPTGDPESPPQEGDRE